MNQKRDQFSSDNPQKRENPQLIGNSELRFAANDEKENLDNAYGHCENNTEVAEYNSASGCSFRYPTPQKLNSPRRIIPCEINDFQINGHEVTPDCAKNLGKESKLDFQEESSSDFEDPVFMDSVVFSYERDVYPNNINSKKAVRDKIYNEKNEIIDCCKIDPKNTNGHQTDPKNANACKTDTKNSNKNGMKSSLKTNGSNNPKKWVTFNEIIQSECEQNFVDHLYEESPTELQNTNLQESSKILVNSRNNFSHKDVSAIQNQRRDEISAEFQNSMAKSDRLQLKSLIERVKLIK